MGSRHESGVSARYERTDSERHAASGELRVATVASDGGDEQVKAGGAIDLVFEPQSRRVNRLYTCNMSEKGCSLRSISVVAARKRAR